MVLNLFFMVGKAFRVEQVSSNSDKFKGCCLKVFVIGSEENRNNKCALNFTNTGSRSQSWVDLTRLGRQITRELLRRGM